MPSRIRPTTPRTSANSSGTPRDPARRTAQLSLSRPSARPLNACALAVPAQASGPKSGAKSGASRPPSKGPPGTTTRPDPLDPTSAFFKVGIEAEFYLSGRNQEDISRFVKLLAIDYNEKHAFEHPRMRESLRPQNHDGDFAEWCLTLDDSVKSTSWPCKSISSCMKTQADYSIQQGVSSWSRQSSWHFLAPGGGQMLTWFGTTSRRIIRSKTPAVAAPTFTSGKNLIIRSEN